MLGISVIKFSDPHQKTYCLKSFEKCSCLDLLLDRGVGSVPGESVRTHELVRYV